VLITEDMLDEDELEDEGLEKDNVPTFGELRAGLAYKQISGEYNKHNHTSLFFLLFIITLC
jgi:hypothetical protein